MQVAYGWGDLGNAVCASGTRGGQGSAGHGDLGATAEVARQNVHGNAVQQSTTKRALSLLPAGLADPSIGEMRPFLLICF